MQIFVGIDPGKDGAIFGIDENGSPVCKEVMPTVGITKLEYNPEKIKAIFHSLNPAFICVENPSGMEGYSKNSVASLKYCIGLIEGIALGLNIPCFLTHPKTWQKISWGDHKKVTYMDGGKLRIDTKSTSLLVAQKLLPGYDWRKSERARVPHGGLIDAYLIAYYCRKQFR